jgi:hypothetical protein
MISSSVGSRESSDIVPVGKVKVPKKYEVRKCS